MDFGGATLALLLITLLALIVLAALFVWRSRDGKPPPPAASPMPTPAARPVPASLGQQLQALQVAGRWPELLRLLDQSLPEWPVSSSLIEVARAVSVLERDIAAVRGTAVSQVVTDRLSNQAQSVTDGLWSLADRLVAADRLSSAPPREQLQREDAVLLRLLPAIKEAQAGLVTLTLASSSTELSRAEGRFLALAATAQELQELGPPPTVR